MSKHTTIVVRNEFKLPVDEKFVLPKTIWEKNEEEIAMSVPLFKPYVFLPNIMRDIFAWLQCMTEPMLIWGQTGCGKTSVVEQTANRLGIPVWKFTGNEEAELSQIFGHKVINPDGSTSWQDGPLTKAARVGGWFLINEADRMRPGVLVGLNDVLEMGPFSLDGNFGEVVVPHPDFRIIVTANTNFAGDMTRTYNTAKVQDKSVIERFGMIIEGRYPTAEEEQELLLHVFKDADDKQMEYWFSEENIKVTSVKDENVVVQGEFVSRFDFVSAMVRLANMIRSQAVSGASTAGQPLERTMSTRTLIRWAEHCITFRKMTEKDISPLHYALERALTNGCTDTTKTTIHNLVKQVFAVEQTLS